MRRTISSSVVGGLVAVAAWVGPGAVGSPASADPSGAAGTDASRTSVSASSSLTALTRTPPAAPVAVAGVTQAGMLRPGDSGPAVQGLQQRLSSLGYWLGAVDGEYGDLTRQAVLAFQKAEGLGRDGIAGPETLGRLPAAQRPTGRSTSGTVVEVDLARQLLMVVQNGQVRWVFNTSTGAADTPTPTGQFTVQRQIDGYRHAPAGVLYRPKYFVGGVAIHGYPSVPAYPASHACTRVSNPAMDLIWSSGVAEIGAPVLVY